jgi:glycosyltransferase involved in cell wall biosynthesis
LKKHDKKIRILYLAPGPAPLEPDPLKNKFHCLSKFFEGDLLHPMWAIKGLDARARLEAMQKASGRFNCHFTFSFHLPVPFRFIKDFFFYLTTGLKLNYFSEPFDIIVSYGPFKTGLAGYLLKLITGKKLIIEIPGNPIKSFDFEARKKNTIEVFKAKSGKLLTNFLLKKSDHIKLLYPEQINGFGAIRRQKVSVFHNFVPISELTPTNIEEKFIFFLGYPWYLKGVDVLIKAFKKIYSYFPDYKLKIVGFCPDKSYFENLAENCPAIELCNAVKHEVAMDLMKRCTCFVLPSRTEAMGRVLLEAMASKKAIIASAVDGIPHYIKDGYNGLLFPPEDSVKLSDRLTLLLTNSQLKTQLAENGFSCVHQQYTEERFVENFNLMIEKVL